MRKHGNSDIHHKACDIERRPATTLSQIYRSTPLGKTVASASFEQVKRLSKLFDIAYVVAKGEMAFAKYTSLMELEKRHSVDFGNTYVTEHKCKEFTMFIGETLRESVIDDINSSPYFSVLIDGSTDSSVKEKS